MSIVALLLIVFSNILFQLLIYRKSCKAMKEVIKRADEDLEQSYRLKETIWEIVWDSEAKRHKTSKSKK